MSDLLEIAGLSLSYGSHAVLHDVSLSLASGEILGLVGESGSGKSSIGMAVLGLLDPAATIDQGSIGFQGCDLVALGENDRRALRGRQIALVPQEPMISLNPTLRIGKQIDLVLAHHRLGNPAARRRIMQDALASVHIDDPQRILNSWPFQLSGGQLQRALIAIAFALRPKLIIADEPTTALDATVQGAVLDLLAERAREEDTGVLLISHNLGLVRRYADRVVVLRQGIIVESGLVQQVLDQPQHPYTRALMAALPGRAAARQPLQVSVR